jgi:multiple sugar transport system substrate-binding protein
VCRDFGMHEGRWIAIPTAAGGGAVVYRKSMVSAAGFADIPKDLYGFLNLCKALKARGTPPGLALGHATGDANGWTHWILWSFGGRIADGKCNSPSTPKRQWPPEYARELYQTFAPGTLSWLDRATTRHSGERNQSDHQRDLIYYAAKTSTTRRCWQ